MNDLCRSVRVVLEPERRPRQELGVGGWLCVCVWRGVGEHKQSLRYVKCTLLTLSSDYVDTEKNRGGGGGGGCSLRKQRRSRRRK